MRGFVTVLLVEEDGTILHEDRFKNLITNIGDQRYGEAGAAIGAVAAPTGMQLGTGNTAAAKSGAGSAIGTYISGSNVAFTATYPQSSKPGTARRIRYRSAWAPTVAQVSNIREAAIVNQAIGTNSGAPEANTICRATFSAVDKSSPTATLYVIWDHFFEGET
jgi:hypothetical protein